MFGTHVIAHCYWGGLLQADFISTSTLTTSSESIEATIKASAFGVSASNSTVTATERKDFEQNTTYEMERYGGKAFGNPSVKDLLKGYQGWVNSVSNEPTVCGIDEFNELVNMLPIWEIAKVFNPTKAADIYKEFEYRLTTCNQTLNDITIYQPVVTDIRVQGQKSGVVTTIPAQYNHAVLTEANKNNHAKAIEASTDKTNAYFLDCNKGKGEAEYVQIFYNTKQIQNYKGEAISDIVVVKGKNTAPPAGYTKNPYDLNAGCGGDSDFLYLAYKKATSNNDEVIDFIGGYYFDSTNLPAAPANDSSGRWEYVKKSGTTQAADLAETCGSGTKYIRLIVHKTTASKNNK